MLLLSRMCWMNSTNVMLKKARPQRVYTVWFCLSKLKQLNLVHNISIQSNGNFGEE